MALEAGACDLVLSRFGVMFFHDPVAAFTNLHRATSARGRLAFLCWREMKANPWMARPAAAAFEVIGPPPPPDPLAPGPFAFADRERVRAILERSGYRGVTCEPLDLALNLGPLEGAVRFLTTMGATAKPMADAPEALRARAVDAVRRAIADAETAAGVVLPSATWIVSARAA
jgi:hypothetical protein